MSYANRALIGEAAASTGTTVYDGDRLSTDDSGALRINTSTGTLDLAPQTTLVLRSSGSGQATRLDLTAGTLLLSTRQRPAIIIYVDAASIVAATDAPTIAHIRAVGNKEIRISARRGSLQFSYKGESELIPEGAAYRVLLEPGDDPADTPNVRHPSGKSTKIGKPFMLIAIAAGTAAVAVAAIELSPDFESPDHPGHKPKKPKN